MNANPLRMPIGEDDFRLLRQGGYYFVDKSLFIQEVLEDSRVILILRPRRFGKTLMLSMLRYYFAEAVDGESTEGLFDGLKIQQASQEILQHYRKYPVIFLSFKKLKLSTFEKTYQSFLSLISEAYQEHHYLLDSPTLHAQEKKDFQALLAREVDFSVITDSLKKLSEYLHRHHGIAPIILIDEYDTPIQTGYSKGYYEAVIELFRAFLGEGLKTNPHYTKAVLTGILRVSKESLFSGLNNIVVYSSLSKQYGEYFGFTECEVQSLLKQTNLTEKSEAIRHWYNGYEIAGCTIYNPWSLLNCIKEKGSLRRHWINTSDNALVKDCLYQSGLIHKEKLEQLLCNQTVACLIDENIIFPDLKNLVKQDSVVLSFLLMAGYFKAVSIDYTERGEFQCQLAIPNKEIKGLYAELIENWLTEGQNRIQGNEFLDPLLHGDIPAFEESFRFLLENTISVHDLSQEPEAFYHGFMTGLTAYLQSHPDYELKSNRESGFGRYDYLILSKDLSKPSILIEFKRVRAKKNIKEALEKSVRGALKQIQKNAYAAQAKQQPGRSICIALAFCGKRFKLLSDSNDNTLS